MLLAAQWWRDEGHPARLSAARQSVALLPLPDGFLPPPPRPAEVCLTVSTVYLMSVCVFTCSCFCTSNFRDVSVVYYTHMFKDVSVVCVLLPLSSCGRTHRWRTGIWEW